MRVTAEPISIQPHRTASSMGLIYRECSDGRERACIRQVIHLNHFILPNNSRQLVLLISILKMRNLDWGHITRNWSSWTWNWELCESKTQSGLIMVNYYSLMEEVFPYTFSHGSLSAKEITTLSVNKWKWRATLIQLRVGKPNSFPLSREQFEQCHPEVTAKVFSSPQQCSPRVSLLYSQHRWRSNYGPCNLSSCWATYLNSKHKGCCAEVSPLLKAIWPTTQHPSQCSLALRLPSSQTHMIMPPTAPTLVWVIIHLSPELWQ